MLLFKEFCVFFCFVFVAVSAKPNIQSRIIGGADSETGQFPYAASIRGSIPPLLILPKTHFCGGSVISERFILTDGRCFCRELLAKVLDALGTLLPIDLEITVCTLLVQQNIVVYLNTIYLNGGDRYNVKRVIQHPDFVATSTISAGLIELSTSIPGPVPAISLSCVVPADDSLCTIIGWGRNNVNSYGLSNTLQMANVTILPSNECSAISDSHIVCYAEREIGVCQGDSGGPLVCNGMQVGIVSWNIPCAVGYADALAKIATVLPWRDFILQETGTACATI